MAKEISEQAVLNLLDTFDPGEILIFAGEILSKKHLLDEPGTDLKTLKTLNRNTELAKEYAATLPEQKAKMFLQVYADFTGASSAADLRNFRQHRAARTIT